MIAAAAMSLSSVSVIANALRLRGEGLMMAVNMSWTDRLLRSALSAVLVIVGLVMDAWPLLVVAGLILLTAALGGACCIRCTTSQLSAVCIEPVTTTQVVRCQGRQLDNDASAGS